MENSALLDSARLALLLGVSPDIFRAEGRRGSYILPLLGDDDQIVASINWQTLPPATAVAAHEAH